MAHVVLQPRLGCLDMLYLFRPKSVASHGNSCMWLVHGLYSSTDTCTTLGAKAAHTLGLYRCRCIVRTLYMFEYNNDAMRAPADRISHLLIFWFGSNDKSQSGAHCTLFLAPAMHRTTD